MTEEEKKELDPLGIYTEEELSLLYNIQEDKRLLLADLCARLPYGVMCNIGLKHPLQLQRIFVDKLDGVLLDFYEDGNNYQVYLSEVKPYLRPMSSMTEAEKADYHFYCETVWDSSEESYYHYDTFKSIDWLNEHHFDFHNLIRKGLALAAPQEMYK